MFYEPVTVEPGEPAVEPYKVDEMPAVEDEPKTAEKMTARMLDAAQSTQRSKAPLAYSAEFFTWMAKRNAVRNQTVKEDNRDGKLAFSAGEEENPVEVVQKDGGRKPF
jgi:hypothetical protein